MPTGFETRQPGRSTFASDTPDPVRVSSSASGSSRGVDTIGGNSRSGVVSGEASLPGVAGGLGGFFGNLMEPHIQRRQKEEYVRGAVEQMSRQAGDEIKASNGGFSKIFGQSAYVEGAVNYSAQQAVNEWGTETLVQIDDLKRMPPAELAKYVSDSITKLETGDRYADSMVQAAVFEASGPVIQTIAKQRYIWQQEEGAKVYSANTDAAASLYQQIGVAAAMQSASDEDTAAATQMDNHYRAALMKPAGMDETTWHKSLTGHMRRAAQQGNGYAVEAMRRSGFLETLDDEERTKLEAAVFTLSSRARNEAAMGLAGDISALEANVLGLGRDDERYSPNEAMAEAARINEEFKRRTGFEYDLFDYKDVVGTGKSVWSAMKAQKDRDESRRWAIEDRLQQRAWDAEDRHRETLQTAAAVSAAWGTGDVSVALNMEIGKDGNFQTLANVDYVAGNFSRIVAAHRKSGWTASLVSDQMKANITASIGKEYSPDFEVGYKTFETLNNADPATAGAYFGELMGPLLNYKRMVLSGTSKQQAFNAAFEPTQYAQNDKVDKAANKAITDYMAKGVARSVMGVQLNPWSRTNLNASGAVAMQNAMRREVGIRMKGVGSDLSPEAVVAQVEAQMLKSGSWERYGSLGWSNGPGTTPLWKSMGMLQGEAEEVVPEVIDVALRKAGYRDGIGGDNYAIRHITGPQGAFVAVTPYPEDGEIYPATLIPVADFVKSGSEYRAGRVKTPAPAMHSSANRNDVDAYRRIPGETGGQRLARINREVAAGASPTRR